MVCSFPPPLTDDQLTVALDGEADTSLQEHIDGCAYCRERLAQSATVEAALQRNLNRWDCPSPQMLGDYMLALLPQSDERSVMRHLELCIRCSAELTDLRVFMDDEVAVAVTPAPEREAARERKGLRLGERLARLLPRTPAVALRGGGSGPLMAESDGVTIVLDIQPAATGFDIMGQVVADDQDSWNGALVELRLGAELHGLAQVDDLGGFSYSGVPGGQATVRITAPGGTSVLVPDVELAA